MVKIKKDLKKSIVFSIVFVLLLLAITVLKNFSNQTKPQTSNIPTATISELTVSNSNTNLLAYFTLNIEKSNILKQILISGVPIKFMYYIRVYIPNSHLISFFKYDIADKILIKTVSYDSIKGTYQIHIIGSNIQTITVNSFKDVLNNICQINDLPITSLSNLKKGEQHILKVKVEAKKVLTSVPLKGILSIFSSDIFETNWYEIKFTY